jgi:hypothetical protein
MELPILKGYKKPQKIKYNFILFITLGIALIFISIIVFSTLRTWIENGNGNLSNKISGEINFKSLIIGMISFVFLLFGGVILHEFVHGIIFKIFKYKIVFGFIFPVAVYVIAKDQFIRRRDYLIVSLSSLILIDIVFIGLFMFKVPLVSNIALFILVFNTSGAIGDLWMSLKIIMSPKGSLFYDASSKDNYIYIPEKQYHKNLD